MVSFAIHTASPSLGLAIGAVDTISHHQVWELGRGLSSRLNQCLMEFIQPHQWQDLDYLAVAKGPGGFTGTRVGVVAARTLAQQLEIPLFGISTLAALAQCHSQTSADTQMNTPIAVTMPAKRGAVYGGIYQPNPSGLTAVFPDKVIQEADWEVILNQWSDDHGETCDRISLAAGDNLGESVLGVLALAQQQWKAGERPHWSDVLPFYCQSPVQS